MWRIREPETMAIIAPKPIPGPLEINILEGGSQTGKTAGWTPLPGVGSIFFELRPWLAQP